MAGKFEKPSGFQAQESAYLLNRIWEELVSRHDFDSAREVARILRQRRAESRVRRFVRAAAYRYPRVAVALCIGYCSLLGAGPIRDYLAEIALGQSVWPLAAALALTLGVSLFFVGVEVQRSLGHLASGLRKRAFRMFGWGLLYAVGTGSFHLVLRELLKHSPPWWQAWKYCCLVAAMALTIGFAAQLFWRDKSSSEPL